MRFGADERSLDVAVELVGRKPEVPTFIEVQQHCRIVEYGGRDSVFTGEPTSGQISRCRASLTACLPT